jgi:hypothetical protein
MLTPQGWIKHAAGTYSVDVSSETPAKYPDLIETGDLDDPKPQKRSSKKK